MTNDKMSKDICGAWIVHHGRKINFDASGAAEFPVIDEAAKAADLLCRLGASDTTELANDKVVALAKAANLNPRLQLPPLLEILESRRLIQRKKDSVEIVGVTTNTALVHAADIFTEGEPSVEEIASIEIAEMTSAAPMNRLEVKEFVGDNYRMKGSAANDFLTRAEEVGFVDCEGADNDRLLFNGNLFRRDTVAKTRKVLGSLTSEDQRKVNEFSQMLKTAGCLNARRAEKILGMPLFEKLKAAGVYDLNTVSNDSGEAVYVTAPDTFHKFVNPMVDDCFDMAKALTAALTYGMTERSSGTGRIELIGVLLRKLIRGGTVGPATAIGHDYRVLELNRVVEITPSGNLFHMRLLKREVGELALKALTIGNANETAIVLPTAPMSSYTGPEGSRAKLRTKQNKASKRATEDILSSLRGGRSV